MSYFSLKNKFLIITLGLIAFLGIAVLSFIKISLQDKLLDELQDKGIFLSKHLSDMSVRPILTEKNFSLQMMVNDYAGSDPDIGYVYIIDQEGNVISHSFKNGFPTELMEINALPKEHNVSIKNISTEQGLFFDIATPVMDGELGSAHIGLTQENIRKNLRNILGVVVKIIIAVLVLGGIIAIVFSSRLSRPLSELVNVSDSIGRGDFEKRVRVHKRDEIGKLAQTFNKMAENLLTFRNELLDSNKQLEREITERISVETNLDRSLAFLHSVFDSIRDPFIILDDEYRIVKVNEAYAHIKGKETDDLTGGICYRELNGREEVCENCVVAATFRSKDPCVKEKSSTLPDETVIWLELYTYPVLDDDMNVTHVIEYTRDISDRKRAEDERKNLINELGQLSRTDSLTGLLNRRALIEILDYDFKRSSRYNNELSLMICDIDYLKTINDTFGHQAGDAAIKTVSETLKSLLRESDIVGRYGGDEFIIILPETTLSGAEELAERIRKETEETDVHVTDDKTIKLTLSIGISDNSNVDNVDEIISTADEALYVSKRMGRNRIFTDRS